MAFAADKPDLTVAVIGAGTMGRGIAQVAAAGGMAVLLHDAQPAAVAAAIDAIGDALATQVAKGRLDPDAARAARERLRPAPDLDACAAADLAVEAIVERLDAKQALFQALAQRLRADAILATNTSSLSVAAIAAATPGPERVAGLHFFNPVPAMKLVEVIGGVRTAPWVVETLMGVGRRMGRVPVRAADMPGFLVNHAGRGFLPEAARILAHGVAAAADIDRILKDAAGFRMGPFELADLVGLDVSTAVMASIYDQQWHEPMYQPTALLAQRAAAGVLGRKTGAGFYDYPQGRIEPPLEPPVPDDRPGRVWISRTDGPGHDAVAAVVAEAGIAIDAGERPAADSLCVVTPVGEDATSAAVRHGLDARRTVAIDCLFGLGCRRSVMATPATDPAMRRAALGLFGGHGVPATLLRDSPGFVAQRVVAMVVNVGTAIAEQRIATPADIDRGVELGLNYPQGPLAWGDALGPARVLALLETLHRVTGEPRYRPTGWLRRRAQLGLSLLTED